MSLTPQITLTATLQDICGNEAGSVSNPARLRIVLCGYGLTLPVIVGTSSLAQIEYEIASTGSPISISLWGQDDISPSGTFYQITILDGNGRTLQCGAYQFFGTQTIDLSNATQIVPSGSTPSGLGSLELAVCNGTKPGTVFTASGIVVCVFVNGLLQRPTIDYTVSGTTITFTYTVGGSSNVYALCIV